MIIEIIDVSIRPPADLKWGGSQIHEKCRFSGPESVFMEEEER